jgi:hypothetical protein
MDPAGSGQVVDHWLKGAKNGATMVPCQVLARGQRATHHHGDHRMALGRRPDLAEQERGAQSWSLGSGVLASPQPAADQPICSPQTGASAVATDGRRVPGRNAGRPAG